MIALQSNQTFTDVVSKLPERTTLVTFAVIATWQKLDHTSSYEDISNQTWDERHEEVHSVESSSLEETRSLPTGLSSSLR